VDISRIIAQKAGADVLLFRASGSQIVIHKRALHKEVADERLARELNIRARRATVDEVSVPDQYIALLRMEVVRFNLMFFYKTANVRLVSGSLRRVAFVLEISLADTHVIAEHIW
jgi:hypothetical protein